MDIASLPSITEPPESEVLRDIFFNHPNTNPAGMTRFIKHGWLRGIFGGMDRDETEERSTHTNGPLTMKLVQITCDETERVLSVVSVRIIDPEHGLSAPKYITEPEELREALKSISTKPTKMIEQEIMKLST